MPLNLRSVALFQASDTFSKHSEPVAQACKQKRLAGLGPLATLFTAGTQGHVPISTEYS